MLRQYILPRYIEIRSNGFLKELNSLLKSRYYSEMDLIDLQEEKMQKLIKFAYKNVPYYKEKFDEYHLAPSDLRHLGDLKKLPVLTKQEMKANIQKLVPRKQMPNVFVRTTSGSTGTPCMVYIDGGSALIEDALFYRFLFSMGYEWGDQIIKFWGAHDIQYNAMGRIVNNLKKGISDKIWNTKVINPYDLDRNTVRKSLALLSGDATKILRGYTSAVYSIALEIMKSSLKVNVKGISTTAEKLFDYQRRVIEKAFHQEVYDQYGGGETNSIAFECEKHNGLHVASEHVILELLNDADEVVDKGSGRVIITNLDNFAMPIIRYENGDLAKWSNNTCSCGCNQPLLEHIEGRIYEMLTVPGNKKIHGGFFDDVCIDMGLTDRYVIDAMRFVQEDLYNYRLEFVMGGKLSEGDISSLKEKYRRYLGDVNVKVEYINSIPPTKMGKRMFIIPYHYNNPTKES
jgi:phenylacetate-CoA ligase